jgi:hypothetical protein
MLTLFVIFLHLVRWDTLKEMNWANILIPIILAAIIEWGKFDILKYFVWGTYGIVFLSLFAALGYLHAVSHISDTVLR